MIVDLCRTFHCTPSQLMAEDAEIIQLAKLDQLYRSVTGAD